MAQITVLGSVSLPDGMVWGDRNSVSMVIQEVKQTLGGRPVVFFGSLSAGRQITLTSQQDACFLTLSQVEEIQSMAEDPGYVFTLQLEGLSRQVMFRHNEPPAFEAVPVIPRNVPLAGDYFRATIKLITV